MNKHNFSAGPSILPQQVIEEASKSVKEWNSVGGLSLIEVSHRSKEFVEVVNESTQLIKELLDVPEHYEVLFLQGGASTQFCMVPYNFLKEGERALYLDTGVWASKAIKESKLFGDTEIVASSKDKNYNYIPNFNIDVDKHFHNVSYLHITTNNTIYGTQLYEDLDIDIPLIADMSSDIFSRKIDVSKYDLIYAGAQKNIGPAGVTIVIVNKYKLGRVSREIPTMLNYHTHIDKKSMFNTPPVFSIYCCLLTLRWLKENGGVGAIQKNNEYKSNLLYNEIDRNELFEGTAEKDCRSKMNITFMLKDNNLEESFLKMCDDRGIVGIKGHRSVGGFRASIYNAMSIDSINYLINVMQDLEMIQASK